MKDFPRGTKPLAKNDKGEWVDPITGKKARIMPFPEGERINFVEGTARPLMLQPGTKIYRVTDRADGGGGYWTFEKPRSKEQWRNDYAVLEEWGVEGKYLSSYTVKDGDNIGAWVGGAAKQIGDETGEVRLGGKDQLLLDSD